MADDNNDNTVTTDGIAGPRMLWNPTTTIHIGDSTEGDVQGGDGIEIFDLDSGADTAGAERNFNIILGGSGDDTITATGKSAWLFGGTGNDTIDGGGGHDIIYGGAGDDSLTGGSGAGISVFSEGHGTDTI